MNKIYRVSVRLTGKEFEALKIISKREDLNLSEAQRLLIREGIVKRGLSSVSLAGMMSHIEAGFEQ
ncbi:MAG: hypothetical protein LLG42_16495 [Chloroflexi bacterium]|nr:hypothetical protein [Chloroflexota bacterium]